VKVITQKWVFNPVELLVYKRSF